MKNLKLKMKDLTNPTILSHHEIKNIMGGSGTGGLSMIRCFWGTEYLCSIEASACYTNVDYLESVFKVSFF